MIPALEVISLTLIPPLKGFQVFFDSSSEGYQVYFAVLGTCATFSATAPLARTEKGGACRGGAKVKNNDAVEVARKKNGANSRHFRTKFFIEI